MSKGGFDNETEFINALNNKTFGEINENLKKFLTFAVNRHIDSDETVKARKDGQHAKADVVVTVGENTFRVSLKIGSGNSVHQEKIDEFIDFLKENYSIDESLENDIRFFIWGDLTLDGSGSHGDRMSSAQIAKSFPDKILNIMNFFNLHKKDLIARFITGKSIESVPDFIYYGSSSDGIWAESKKVIDFLGNSNKKKLGVGGLNFQAWNRAIKSDSRSESKRGEIQLKWPSIKNDLVCCQK